MLSLDFSVVFELIFTSAHVNMVICILTYTLAASHLSLIHCSPGKGA